MPIRKATHSLTATWRPNKDLAQWPNPNFFRRASLSLLPNIFKNRLPQNAGASQARSSRKNYLERRQFAANTQHQSPWKAAITRRHQNATAARKEQKESLRPMSAAIKATGIQSAQ